jgi:hypothetical protein
VRAYLGYTGRLIGAHSTLTEHRRLLVTGGWLSLLAATCLIDLHRDRDALAHLRTAAQFAQETGHTEMAAWCLETRAWQVLTAGVLAATLSVHVLAAFVVHVLAGLGGEEGVAGA